MDPPLDVASARLEMIRAHQSARERCESCHGAFHHDEKEPR